MKHDGGAGVATCVVEVSVNGTRSKAQGSVLAEVPMLEQLEGSPFRQPVPLAGHLLFFKAAASPQLLPSITGEGHGWCEGGSNCCRSEVHS